MKSIYLALLGLIAVFTFEACIFDSSDSPNPNDTTLVGEGDTTIIIDTVFIVDTSINSEQIGPDGTRKPRPPVVTYDVFDSLVYIQIVGSRLGEESYYWIYRNNLLLDAPVLLEQAARLPKLSAQSTDQQGQAQIIYMLLDSVKEVGTYTYNVQYGKYDSTKSEKSEDFVYEYFGISQSGSLALANMENGQIIIQVHLPSDGNISQIYIERKVGKDGTVEIIDTVLTGLTSQILYQDTGYINLDTTVYYRVTGMDAVSEEWLTSSHWDSVTIENKVWSYLPVINLIDRGNEVEVAVLNPLSLSDKVEYTLYYNTTSSRTGKKELDSFSGSGSFTLSGSIDNAGVYYFWVEATDDLGRESARSVPVAVNYLAQKKGPAVTSVTPVSNYLRVEFQEDDDAIEYIIERTQDTTQTPVAIDTIDAISIFSGYSDFPTEDGYFFYRIISVVEGDGKTLPGDWTRSSSSFTYSPVYSTISIPIDNLGDRVVATFTSGFTDSYSYILYRSADKNGDEETPVDTLEYNELVFGMLNELEDVPPVGTWYYRVVREDLENNSTTIYRTNLQKVIFTGKIMGPPILQISNNVTSIVLLVQTTPDAIAYIIERSLVEDSDVTALDTLGATTSGSFQFQDIPTNEGHYRYRVKFINENFAISEPGPWYEMTETWSFSQTYYTFTANIYNKGKYVEGQVQSSSSYVYYFFRSVTNDYNAGVLVDTLAYLDLGSTLTDGPAAGTFYYWIERHSVSGSNQIIYRTVPREVNFTGAPEILALSTSFSGVNIFFPPIDVGDSTEIWVNFQPAGPPLGEFEHVGTAGYFSSSFTDTSPSEPGFYHYALFGVFGGVRGPAGAIKSIYYEP